jgi:hypothetical protein
MQRVSKRAERAERAGEQVLTENHSWPICPGTSGSLGQIFQTYQPSGTADAVGGLS